MRELRFIAAAALLVSVACRSGHPDGGEVGAAASTEASNVRQVTGPDVGLAPRLPEPDTTRMAVNFPRVIGWASGGQPTAPEGFTVTLFADSLEYPRWL